MGWASTISCLRSLRIMKRHGCDLVVVLVHNATRIRAFDHPNGNVVTGQNRSNLSQLVDALPSLAFKDRELNILVLEMRVEQTGERRKSPTSNICLARRGEHISIREKRTHHEIDTNKIDSCFVSDAILYPPCIESNSTKSKSAWFFCWGI